MRRADRLFQIVQYLRGGRLWTSAQLAERLEVTPRTIYRDMADLMASGVPIDGEAGVGYILRDGYDLPPLMFNTEEIVALVAGARLIRAFGGAQMAAGAEEALAKINTVLPDAARTRAEAVQVHAMDQTGLTDETRALLDRIESAANARHRLILSYREDAGAETTRTIRPFGIWFWGRVWTAVGWCELRDDFRMFRVDRIAAMEEGDIFRYESGKTFRDFMASHRYRRD